MSVIVMDMEMPETCDECKFHRYHSHYEYVCVATPLFYPMNLANSKGARKDWCPLIELPETCDTCKYEHDRKAFYICDECTNTTSNWKPKWEETE